MRSSRNHANNMINCHMGPTEVFIRQPYPTALGRRVIHFLTWTERFSFTACPEDAHMASTRAEELLTSAWFAAHDPDEAHARVSRWETPNNPTPHAFLIAFSLPSFLLWSCYAQSSMHNVQCWQNTLRMQVLCFPSATAPDTAACCILNAEGRRKKNGKLAIDP